MTRASPFSTTRAEPGRSTAPPAAGDLDPERLQGFLRRAHAERADAVHLLLLRIGRTVRALVRPRSRAGVDEGQLYDLVEHELRTPLTAIRSAAEILRDHVELTPEERRRFLDVVLADNARLERFVDRLLAAASAPPRRRTPSSGKSHPGAVTA